MRVNGELRLILFGLGLASLGAATTLSALGSVDTTAAWSGFTAIVGALIGSHLPITRSHAAPPLPPPPAAPVPPLEGPS